MAALLGTEDAVYVASGTMSNQIAVRTHTMPGDSALFDQNAHVYLLEGGGIAALSGVLPRLLPGVRGIFSADDVRANATLPFTWTEPACGTPPPPPAFPKKATPSTSIPSVFVFRKVWARRWVRLCAAGKISSPARGVSNISLAEGSGKPASSPPGRSTPSGTFVRGSLKTTPMPSVWPWA